MDKRIRLMSKLLNELFSEDEVNALAYDLGFLRRKGKVTPIEFIRKWAAKHPTSTPGQNLFDKFVFSEIR